MDSPYPNQRTVTAKGERPQFAEDRDIDRAMAIAMAIAGEVAALRERLDTFETLVARQGGVTADDIENFVPDAAHEARREQWRHDFLDRVLYVMRAEADAVTQESSTDAGKR